MPVILLNQIREEVLKVREDVVSIVIFGSYARGEQYEDLDVLVVIENLKPSLEDLKKATMELKNALKLGMGIDLLVYSREDCEANFRDHQPLFLDIAFDGVIVYDQGFIGPLVEEAKRYVVERGIERISTLGWRFPVSYRQETLLSARGNKEDAELWLSEAGGNLGAARYLFEGKFYAQSVMECQQAVEKSVKAVLACFGVYVRSHFVGNLLEEELRRHQIKGWTEKLSYLARISKEIEPEAIWSRYPGKRGGRLWIPSKAYGGGQTKNWLEKGEESLGIAEGFVAWWFEGG